MKPKAEASKKSETVFNSILELMKKCFIFKTIDPDDYQTVISAMQKRTYTDGEQVIKQGDDGSEMYLVEKGSLNCTKTIEDGSEMQLRTQVEGEAFGELALMYNVPRAANIRATSDCVLWALDRATFNYYVKDSAIRRRQELIEFLGSVSVLSEVSQDEKEKLADCFAKETQNDDEKIINQGDAGDKFYLVKEGEA